MRAVWAAVAVVLAILGLSAFAAQTQPVADRPADRVLADYFRSQVAEISAKCLSDIKTLEDWTTRREEYRRELAEMLGLWPMPQRTDLKVVITGKVERPDFVVEKLHFQSMPGLYVTANLYVPKDLKAKAPAILYVCGHGNNKKDGISYGAKSAYEHHGAWFARNGYVCLILDTIELGELEGTHHGTYRDKMWWWHSRGYVPSGVETWNGIRAIDYLQSRAEVDPERIGLTGRSGGGAHTWWIGAMDDRVKVAVPVAGITDLQNHVVDGCIEGHCDCMFMVNTYRWDFAQVAALMAPRPLLISNSDKDTIFPLDGVQRVHAAVKRIYKLYKAEDKLGLLITEGPHKDTQDLQVPTFRWFNRFLKNETGPVEIVAKKVFEPDELRVFQQLPEDQTNTKIQESFVAMAPAPQVPESAEAWRGRREALMGALREKCFRGWPAETQVVRVVLVSSAERNGVRFREYQIETQEHVVVSLSVGDAPNSGRPGRVELHVLDEEGWEASPHGRDVDLARVREAIGTSKGAVAWLAPRGIGPTAWTSTEPRQTHILRRFALIGQTLDGMRVWDIRRAIQAVRSIEGMRNVPVIITGDRQMAVLGVYAAILEPGVVGLDLREPSQSHMQGPQFLNVLKIMDVPMAVALSAERCAVVVHAKDAAAWEYPVKVAQKLAWKGHVQISAD